MCRVLEVSESAYHVWRQRPPAARMLENLRLETEIKAAHQRTRETYGPERLQSDLADHGIQTSVYRIKRLRKKLGLRCKQKRKFKATTDSKHALPLAPNLLDRQFAVATPSRAWVTDITYVATDEAWLYLAGIKDLFNGELVGYALSERMTTTKAYRVDDSYPLFYRLLAAVGCRLHGLECHRGERILPEAVPYVLTTDVSELATILVRRTLALERKTVDMYAAATSRAATLPRDALIEFVIR